MILFLQKVNFPPGSVMNLKGLYNELVCGGEGESYQKKLKTLQDFEEVISCVKSFKVANEAFTSVF